MIVLVVGRQGQLARSLADARPPASLHVLAIGRPELDLLRPETVTQALDRVRPDIVVNTAAYTAVDKAESASELAFAINSEGVALLGLACASRDMPIIHVSTDYVYDGTKPGPYIETDPVNPLNVYGHSKLLGEQQLAEVNPRHIILRTAWVYAAYGTNFVRTMLRLATARRELSVVDDQRGNPTYSPHLAHAILAIIEKLGNAQSSAWGTFHAVGTGATTWFGFAEEIFRCQKALGYDIPRVNPIRTAEYPTTAPRPANSRLNTDKLAHAFGVRLPPWEKGVAECVQWLSPGF